MLNLFGIKKLYFPSLKIPQFANPFVQWPVFVLYAAILFIGQIFIDRNEFYCLLIWQIALHVLFILFYTNRDFFTVKNILIFAIICRLVSVFTIPVLSDDVYRFIWDGQLIANGENPILTTPDQYVAALQTNNINYSYYQQLHALVNHTQNYTCYPPLMQATFYISAIISGANRYVSIISLKIMVAAIDVFGIFCIMKVLQKVKLPVNNVVLYALSPMVIIEGVGNLHYEVVQVAFMAASMYLISQKKIWKAAIVWGLAIVTKLLPILLLPLLIKWLGFKKGIIFSLISIGFAMVVFMPFLSVEAIRAFSKSLNLYFQHFEFNASIYYIARQIGWWVKGYNYISFIGPFLMCIFLSIYGYIFFTKKIFTLQSFASLALVVFTLYYLFATTVHPWYIINLIPFALVVNKKFAMVWLSAAFLSYCAYSNTAFAENFYAVFLEYLALSVAMYFSYKNFNNKTITS